MFDIADLSAGAWIITGGTQTGVMQFVGEAAREYMLQSGNYEQQLFVVVVGVTTTCCRAATTNSNCLSSSSSS